MSKLNENLTNLNNLYLIANSTVSKDKVFINYIDIVLEYINDVKGIIRKQGLQTTKGSVIDVEKAFMKNNIPLIMEKILLLPNYLLEFNDFSVLGKLKDTLIEIVNLKKDSNKQFLGQIVHLINCVYLDLVYVYNCVIQLIEITEIAD